MYPYTNCIYNFVMYPYMHCIYNFVMYSYTHSKKTLVMYPHTHRPPLWSSGQSFWLLIQRSRVRSSALPDFLCSSGSGTGSTQPREPREVN